jgi:hypothetical protein
VFAVASLKSGLGNLHSNPVPLRKERNRISLTRWQHLLNREHANCTGRPSLNKEPGWKSGDRSGLARGQELTGRKEKNKNILTGKGKRKTYSALTGLLMEGLEAFLVHFSMVAVVRLTVLTNSLSRSRQAHQRKCRFFLRVRWGGFLVIPWRISARLEPPEPCESRLFRVRTN